MIVVAFWFLWFFGSLPLFVLDGWFVHAVAPVPAFTLATCLYCGLYARLGTVPGLLLCAALARSVLIPGDAALHLLVLGLPVAALLPTRGVFARSHVLWQALASAFLAVSVPANRHVVSCRSTASREGATVGASRRDRAESAVCLTEFGPRSIGASPAASPRTATSDRAGPCACDPDGTAPAGDRMPLPRRSRRRKGIRSHPKRR